MKMIYVITAHRWGDRDAESYVVGLYMKKHAAQMMAIAEEELRGGKYTCLIGRYPVNEPGLGIKIVPFDRPANHVWLM